MNRGVFLVTIFSFGAVLSLPQFESNQPKSRRPIPIFTREAATTLILPDNATAIRENIVDNFTCKERIYGYYADMENDCQIFHVCLPQARGAMKWSFICPAETVFNQATFVCTRTESSIPCEESESYYELNEELGKVEEENNNSTSLSTPEENEIPQSNYPGRRSRIISQEN
ncbi:U-scoloptoxin(01)-Er1a-like [Belonocnema kinseyi]|uniref:U-scoloptoxin(01)-Er1a-like n=1 Tax=Belonocnema kinseyi TaxID=2817044 RepID=UPI00143D324C|nr:U-scoloptoxin(01)-Er1a-like [Belonocnema kinseyi]